MLGSDLGQGVGTSKALRGSPRYSERDTDGFGVLETGSKLSVEFNPSDLESIFETPSSFLADDLATVVARSKSPSRQREARGDPHR